MNNHPPAGFFLRLLAYFNEKLLFLLLASVFIWNLSKNNVLSSIYHGLIIFLVIIVFYFLVGMVYSVMFTHYFGGNLGKLITGLRVRDQSGSRLNFKKILFRQLLAYQFSWLVFGLGYLSILKDPKKQAWHDKTVDSNVFKVQPLLPLALTIFLLTLGASGYLLKTSFDNFLNNPAKQEILGLVAAFKEQNKNSQNVASQKISKEIQDQQLKVYDLMKANKLDEASKTAQQMLDSSKTNSEKALSMQVIGEVYGSKLDYPKAKTYFTDALKLDQNLSGAYIGLAAANIIEKDFQQAIVNAQKAIDLAPNRTDFYDVLGLAYYGAGDKDKAIQSIEKAIKGNPSVEQYKKDLDFVKNSTSQYTPQTKPQSVTPAQPTGPGYTRQDIDNLVRDLNQADQDYKNIQNFKGSSSYNQQTVNKIIEIIPQRKALAQQLLDKMGKSLTLTQADFATWDQYDALTAQQNSLVSSLYNGNGGF